MAPTITMPMDIPMSSPDAPANSTAPAALATGGMDGTEASSMGPMVMTFFSSAHTSLFSKSWTPTTVAAYAATCIFLLVLAVTMRAMLALKPVLESAMWKPDVNPDPHELLLSEEDCNEELDRIKEQHLVRGQEEGASGLQRVLFEVKSQWRGWRFMSSSSRAIFEVLLAVIGYLL
ncbi:putative Copper transport protein [Seiridium unicorne]|uniref:Copper transport protein n=1 Tax=Seiridium unicorne TaxID=138068 RepID=A0ABR2VF39_9PEZI